MKNFHFLLIVLLAFFLTPGIALACGNGQSEMKCCSKEMTAKTTKKDCCQKKSHSENEKQTGCKGKCGQALCSASAANSAVVSAASFEMEQNNFNFSSKKQRFYPSVSFTSDGYSSIWLIPKIG